jgi:pimeloyl-ACP methyl ester carboxylesterase
MRAAAGATAVLLPGSGSTADFVRRAFGPALAGAGYALVTPDPEPGAGVAAAALDALDRCPAELVGGVSLGAHLAVRWAAMQPRGRTEGMLLALPAWTGAPGPIAAASAVAAAGVERHGTAGALRLAAAAGGEPWVIEELSAAWPTYGTELPATLRATSVEPGPTAEELRAVDVPVGLVGFRDDPMHPAPVVEEWAGLLACCAVEWLKLADLAADRSLLGTAALRALRRAAA